MPQADLGDLAVHYLDECRLPAGSEPDQPPLLFLHGFTLDHRMWQPQVKFFRDFYRVIVPDSRGHGLTSAPETNYSRDHRADDLCRLMDFLKLDRVHLVASSMGGSTAIGLALSSPQRLKSLTLIDTGAAGYSFGPRISKIDRIAREKGLEAARERWMRASLAYYSEDQATIKELMSRMMKEHSGAIWMDRMRGKYPKTRDLDHVERISMPVMIFVGELDRPFIPLSRELHRLIKGSQLHVFENVGHMLNLEAPGRLNKALKLFLEGL